MKEAECLNIECKRPVQYDEKRLEKGWVEFKCQSCETVQVRYKCMNKQCSAEFRLIKADLEQKYAGKPLSCPKCKIPYTLDAKEFNPTVINPNLPILPGILSPGTLIVGTEENELTEPTTISLKIGENTIGRKAESSTATIQLSSRDIYMGRTHLKIRVKQDSRGEYRHYLSDLKSLNGTIHNNYRLQEGEETILDKNDVIKIGKTVLRFVPEPPQKTD